MFKKTISVLLALVFILATCISAVSCSSGKVVMSFENYKVTEDMYRYWMINWKDYYVNNYSDVEDSDEFWQGENIQGGTNEQYLTEQIEQRIQYYLVAQALFEKYKLKLTSQEKDAVKQDIDEQIEYFGSRSAFNSHLHDKYGIDVNVLEDVYVWEAKYNTVYKHLFDVENGIMTSTDAEIDEYYKDNYARVKYVMFFKAVKYVYDDNGKKLTDANGNYKFEDLSEQQQTEVAKKVQKLFEEIKGGADIDPHVEKLMPEFGFDVAKYPNGFYITADEYSLHTAAVTSAALEMEVNEVRLAESEDCFFIIKKLDLVDKAYVGADNSQFTNIVKYSNSFKFLQYFDSFAKDIEYDESFKELYKLSTLSDMKFN